VSRRPAPPGPPATAPSRTGEIGDFLLDAVGSTILIGGQRLLARMRRTLGDGTPEDGKAFGVAGKQFRATDRVLGAAVPSGDWTGAGSDAYTQQNARQQLRAGSLADADHEVHRVLAGEAYQVTFHRNQIDELYNWLGELSQYTRWLELVPRYGEAAKVVVESAAVQTALTSAECELNNMRQEAADNAARLRDLVDHYQGIAASALLPEGGFEGPPAPGATDRGSPLHDEPVPGAVGGRVGGPAAGPQPGQGYPPDESAATDEQGGGRDPATGLAGLAGMGSLVGVVPAMAAALTTPLAASVAPASGAVAAVVQAAVQAAAAVRQDRDDGEDDEGGETGAAGADAAVPAEPASPSAQDGGTGGSGTATVNAGDTRVPDAAARPSATGR
jgi:hypothetical protein